MATHSSITAMNGDGNTAFKPPRGVHLVGSVPLSSAEEVFQTLTVALPGRLHSITDGETGERHYFVAWQANAFAAHPELIFGVPGAPIDQVALAKAMDDIKAAGGIQTHYDTHAIASYQTFVRLRKQGIIPQHVKFQVCLPTPLNGLMMVGHDYRMALEPLYTEAVFAALRNIESQIPSQDLVIQWDCAREFAILADPNLPFYSAGFCPPEDADKKEDHKRGIVDRLAALIDAVDLDVEIGLHCCYGDVEHQHFVQPTDLSTIVEIVNAVSGQTQREIDYIHLPVPQTRSDVAYFTSLGSLHVLQATEKRANPVKLFLGLVHYDDLDGIKERIAAARKVLDPVGVEFGIATECGLGRTPQEQIQPVLDLLREVSGPI